MKIFFTCSTKSIDTNEKYYREIRDKIISLGHKINREWIDYSINIAQRKIKGVPSYTMYKDVMSAILTADAVVVDATIRSMSVGHQLTYALQKGKPVLLLRKINKGKETKKLFIEGSESKDFITRNYEKLSDIEGILKQFFKKYEARPLTRFNLVLTGDEDNYISWAAFNYKKTKTDIIQEAIDKMSEKDIAYKKYLSRQS